MKKEILARAIEISERINALNSCLTILETDQNVYLKADGLYTVHRFNPDEKRMVISVFKEKLADLERELEEL